MKHFIVICILISSLNLYDLIGQNTSNTIIFSENKEYFAKTKPYSSQSYDTIGKVEVIRISDSTLLYTINRFINPKYLFLTNDGLSIIALNNNFLIEFYNSGKKVNQINLLDLKKFDGVICENNLIYEFSYLTKRSSDQNKFEIEYIADKNPFFIHNDTAYLISCIDSILIFDIKKGDYIKSISMYDKQTNIPLNPNDRFGEKEEFDPPNWLKIPALLDGSNFENQLANYIGMVHENPLDYNLKYYNLMLKCLINSNGKCEEAYIDFKIKSKEDSIRQFINSIQFDTTIFPKPLEKWIFQDAFIPLRNTNIKIAKKELEEEKIIHAEMQNLNLLSDSIKGIYIPVDLSDCMIQLDKLLTDERKNKFLKNGADFEHFGLGLWIRNNWGLWSGSRLQTYFLDLGFNHPDNMSGFILDTYYKYLKDNSINFQAEINKYLNQ